MRKDVLENGLTRKINKINKIKLSNKITEKLTV
jgi:hypothetical protein